MTPRPAKPKADRKEDRIVIRVTAEQKRVLAAAAERVGLDTGTWMRSVALQEAARQVTSR